MKLSRCCHNLGIMSLNPGQIELWMHNILILYWNQNAFGCEVKWACSIQSSRKKSSPNNALKICCKIVSKTYVQMLFFDQSVKEKSLQNSYIEQNCSC